MKSFCLLFVGVCAGVLLFGDARSQGPKKKVVLEANEIVLTSPDGKRKITILASDTVAGIWLHDHVTKRTVAIYDNKEQCGIGIYANEDKPLLNCLTVTPAGDGFLQLYKGGELYTLPAGVRAKNQ